jgi:hypothetical protein
LPLCLHFDCPPTLPPGTVAVLRGKVETLPQLSSPHDQVFRPYSSAACLVWWHAAGHSAGFCAAQRHLSFEGQLSFDRICESPYGLRKTMKDVPDDPQSEPDQKTKGRSLPE